MSGTTTWDLAIVGAGPAGAAAAIGALGVKPELRVGLLDRSTFPRDKSCGDGIAPHVVDLLEEAGVPGLLADHTPVRRLRLHRGDLGVDRAMARSTWVVPRAVLDHRLVLAAQQAGAELVHERVREVGPGSPVRLGERHEAAVVVGADGAHSVVRRALGLSPGPMAMALRGYAPTPADRAAAQVIAFEGRRQPAYAWSFDRGDGWSNVGYGVLLGRAGGLSKDHLRARLDALLPGAGDEGVDWRGHHLPLSTGRWRPRPGPVLLAGDAAGLINPMTGEGIYYAVLTGLAAGRAAARALVERDPASAGARYAAAVRPLLDDHLRHIRIAAWLCRRGVVVDAGLRAAAADQRVYDDLVELGLARGRITGRMLRGLGRHLPGVPFSRTSHPSPDEESTPCAS